MTSLHSTSWPLDRTIGTPWLPARSWLAISAMDHRDETRAKTPQPNRIEPYLDRLLAYALSLTENPDDAKDMVQSCAANPLGARHAPAAEPAYRTWLFRILRNTFIDRTRQQAVR